MIFLSDLSCKGPTMSFLTPWKRFRKEAPQRRSSKRELAFFRSWIREDKKNCWWIRENDVVRDSWKRKISFVNSWNLKGLFANSGIPIHLWLVNWQNHICEIVKASFAPSHWSVSYKAVPMGTEHTVAVLGQGRVGNCQGPRAFPPKKGPLTFTSKYLLVIYEFPHRQKFIIPS